MIRQDPDGKKLEEELVRLGFPSGKRGDARARAEVLGTTTGAVRQWLTDRYATPTFVWIVLKLYSLLTAEGQTEFRRWARARFDRGDYRPDD